VPTDGGPGRRRETPRRKDARRGGQAFPWRHRPAGTAARSGLGERLHRQELPRQPVRLALRLRPRTPGGGLLDRGHRRHPLERRQQVPVGGILQRREDLAEHLRRAERQRLQDRHVVPPHRHGPVRAGLARRGTEARHARRGILHQQGRHLRAAAEHRPARHHQRRPRRHHHRAAQARPRIGPEDQRRLLDRLPGQRRVLQNGQQELPGRCGHSLEHRRPDQGRGGLHGPGGRRRQAHRHHAGRGAGADGPFGDRAPTTPSPTRTRASSASRSGDPNRLIPRLGTPAGTSPTAAIRATRRRRGTCWPTRRTCRSSRWRSSTARSRRPSRRPRRTSTSWASACGATTTSAWPSRTRG